MVLPFLGARQRFDDRAVFFFTLRGEPVEQTVKVSGAN